MNRTILVVDDDKKIVDLVSLYLKRDGYSVLAAYDGQEALDTARRKQPDLIVLDLLMPELDGTDVCRLLRAESQRPDHHADGPQHRRRQAPGPGHRRG